MLKSNRTYFAVVSFLVLASMLCFSYALAITIEKPLGNPTQESRARLIFREIKCLVCDGQAINGSDSEFARSMRTVIREQIAKGLTDEEIYHFIEDKYGSDILLKPPFTEETALIWLAPFLVIAFGMVILVILLRPHAKPEVISK